MPDRQDTLIRGSTTILELMERFPGGRALDLMARLGWPCGHCSARSTEPLSLAAKRHGNPVRAVIECFRALEGDGPTEAALDAARARARHSPDPIRAWLRSAERYRSGGEFRTTTRPTLDSREKAPPECADASTRPMAAGSRRLSSSLPDTRGLSPFGRQQLRPIARNGPEVRHCPCGSSDPRTRKEPHRGTEPFHPVGVAKPRGHEGFMPPE